MTFIGNIKNPKNEILYTVVGVREWWRGVAKVVSPWYGPECQKFGGTDAAVLWGDCVCVKQRHSQNKYCT